MPKLPEPYDPHDGTHVCRRCKVALEPGGNWIMSRVRKRDRICTPCRLKQKRETEAFKQELEELHAEFEEDRKRREADPGYALEKKKQQQRIEALMEEDRLWFEAQADPEKMLELYSRRKSKSR